MSERKLHSPGGQTNWKHSNLEESDLPILNNNPRLHNTVKAISMVLAMDVIK